MTPTLFARRRRLAARVALYSSLLLIGGVTWLLVAFLNRPLAHRSTEDWARLDYPNLPEVKLLRRYVQIDTSETTGDEVAGARFLAAQLAAAGIPSEIETLGRHANLYARLEGQDPHPLVLHNHIKVGGKTVTRLLTEEQMERYGAWFDNAKRIRTLAGELEALSLDIANSAEGWS